MRTIAEIRAALAAASTESERSALITELEQAIARAGTAQPSELEQARTRLADVTTQRDGLIGQIEQITTAAVDDDGNARAYTPEEAEQRGRLLAQLDVARAQHTEIEDRARQLEHDERENRMVEQVAQMRRELGLGEQSGANVLGGGVAVLNEPRTYERGNGESYLLDLCLARTMLGQGLGVRSQRAQERLQRFSRENHVTALEIDERIGRLDQEKRERELRTRDGYFLSQMVETYNQRDQNRGPISARGLSYRALSTAATAGGEFVPPMYLTEEWIAYARPGRVLADLQHHQALPDGTMSINIPKVTGGTSTATQGTQNTNVANVQLQTAFVTFPVVTKAGAQLISLQLLERSPINFDEVVGRDLALAYAQDLNYAIHSGTGIAGDGGADIVGILNTAGIYTVTWTQGTPTLKGLYGQVGYAKTQVATGRKLPATHRVMQSLEWEWIDAYFDTANRPLVTPTYAGPFNAVTVAPDAAVAQGTIGRKLQELDTFVDLTLPINLGSGANQLVDIIGRFDENYLYESPITTRMLPQTYGMQLSMLLQLYGYSAFTAARYPVANAAIVGTGLASANMTFAS